MENNPFLKGKKLKKTGRLDTIVNKELEEIKQIDEKQIDLMQSSIENQKKSEIYKDRTVNPPKVVNVFDLFQEK
jgi:hypothetical protein